MLYGDQNIKLVGSSVIVFGVWICFGSVCTLPFHIDSNPQLHNIHNYSRNETDNNVNNRTTVISGPLHAMVSNRACLIPKAVQGRGDAWRHHLAFQCVDDESKWIEQEKTLHTRWGAKVRCYSDLPTGDKLHGTTALVWPPFARHVNHFTESVIGHVNAKLDEKLAPIWDNIRRIVVLSPKKGELEHNTKYIELVEKFLGVREPTIWGEQLSKTLCFERALVVAGAPSCSRPGPLQSTCRMFSTTQKSRIWRQFVHSNTITQKYTSDLREPIRVYIVQRSKTGNNGARSITNLDVLMKYLRSQPWVDQEYFSSKNDGRDLSKLSFKEQMDIFVHTDIYIAVHGSALNNCHLMTEHSVVMEVLPGPFIEVLWSQMAFENSLYYMPVFPVPSPGRCTDTPNTILYNPMRQGLKSCNTKISMPHMEVYLDLASRYILNRKRKPIHAEFQPLD